MAQYRFTDAPPEKFKISSGGPEEVPQPEATPLAAPAEPTNQVKGNLGASFNEAAKDVGGGAELVGQMASGFAAAIPATVWGTAAALTSGDPQDFAIHFKKLQMALTYEPRSEHGKAHSETMSKLMEMYSDKVDKYLVEPNEDHHNSLMATIGKTAGEALPLLLPMMRMGKKGAVPSPEEPKNKDIVPTKPALEGEIIPSDKGLSPQERAVLEAKEKPPIEGKAVPVKADMDTQVQMAKGDKNSLASAIDWKDIEAAKSEDPYQKLLSAPDGTPSGEGLMYGGGPGWEQVKGGIESAIKAIDESNAMNEWRKFARPLQAGNAAVSAEVKNFANMKRVFQHDRITTLKDLDTIPSDIRESMIRSIENPSLRESLDPKVLETVDKLVRENEDLSQQALDLKIIGNVRKPYAPHIIKQVLTDPLTREQLNKQGYVRTGMRTGQRKYSTFEEGEAAGQEYIIDIKAMVDINYQLKEAIYGRHFVNYIKQFKINGKDLAGFAGEDNPGYVTINHPAFREKNYIHKEFIQTEGKKYYVKDDTVFVGNKEYPVNNGYVHIDGKSLTVQKATDVMVKNINVHPDVAGPLKAVLEANDPNALTQAIVRVKASTIGVIMYNPMFHNLTVWSRMIPTLPGAGLGEFIWNPEKIVGKDVYNNLSSAQKVLSRTWVSDFTVGNYLNSIPENVTAAIKHNLVPLSGRGYRADLYGELEPVRKNILQNFAGTKKIGEGLETLGDFWHGYLLWDRIGDAQMGLYNRYSIDFAETGIKEFTKQKGRVPTDTEIKQITEDSKYAAGEMANTIAGVFAREDFGKQWQNFLNSSLFSRSNTMANVRLAEYGMGTMPKHLIGQMKALDSTVGKGTAQAAFTGYAIWSLTKDMFLLMGTLYGLNYALTKSLNIPDKNGNTGGHLPSNNEPGKEMHIAIGRKPDGTIVYMAPPFRSARDIAEMITKPATLWNNKLNPIVKTMYEELTNHDWKGKEIRLTGDSWQDAMTKSAVHMAKGVTGFDTTFNTFNPDDESWQNRYRFLGLQISQGTPGGMVAGNIRNIQREQAAQKDMVMQEALDMGKRGNMKGAIEKLKDNRLFDDIPGFVIRSKDPYASMLLHLNLGDMYLKATPEQKKELDQIKYGRKAE